MGAKRLAIAPKLSHAQFSSLEIVLQSFRWNNTCYIASYSSEFPDLVATDYFGLIKTSDRPKASLGPIVVFINSATSFLDEIARVLMPLTPLSFQTL